MTAPKWTWENKITFGNLLTIVITIVGLLAGYMTLVGTVGATSEAVKALPSLENRLTKVEVNQTNGRAERIQQQEDLREAFKDGQAATNKRLDKMDDTLLQLATAVAGLTATLKAMDPKS